MLGMIIPGRSSKARGPLIKVARSLKFNQTDVAYLNRTPGAPTDAKKGTISLWLKRASLAGYQTNYGGAFYATDTSGQDFMAVGVDASTGVDYIYIVGFSGAAWTLRSVLKLMDTSAWCHVVVALDSTQAVAANRARVYVNGAEVTSWSTDGRASIALNSVFQFFQAAVAKFISRYHVSYGYFDGLMAEYRYVDGQALTPDSFGVLGPNSQWVPKPYTGTYGAQGFYLDFSDNSAATAATIGKDTSGNGNNWTPNNFSVAAGVGNDSAFDSPVDFDDGTVHGNFANLMFYGTGGEHPLGAAAPCSLREARTAYVGGTSNQGAISSLMMRSGKWYCEFICQTVGGLNGIVREDQPFTFSFPGSAGSLSWAQFTDGQKYGPAGNSAYGAAFAAGDIMGCAFDADTGKIWWHKNGVWQAAGDPVNGVNPGFTVTLSAGKGWRFVIGHNPNANQAINFGQRPFNYPPPAGFKALCTTNLPATDAPITAGSFVGNALANGPMVDLGGPPSSMTINGNVVTFGTHARKTAQGVKIISALAAYNVSGANTFTAVVPISRKYARAQFN